MHLGSVRPSSAWSAAHRSSSRATTNWAESSSAEGERDNAERMLVKTRKKLDSLTEAVVDEDLGI